MARPTKWRKIENIPTVPCFIPSNTSAAADLPKNILKLEELEAIRLKDLECLEQEECAEKMEVSRPTFQRILISAREKVADSLINGKMILIEGGDFTLNICPVKCSNCGMEWKESVEKINEGETDDYTCPGCGSKKVYCNKNCRGTACCKRFPQHMEEE